MTLPPIEPSAQHRKFAIEVRRQHIALIDVGFTEHEALELLVAVVCRQMHKDSTR